MKRILIPNPSTMIEDDGDEMLASVTPKNN